MVFVFLIGMARYYFVHSSRKITVVNHTGWLHSDEPVRSVEAFLSPRGGRCLVGGIAAVFHKFTATATGIVLQVQIQELQGTCLSANQPTT
jgi:hypothetical protein